MEPQWETQGCIICKGMLVRIPHIWHLTNPLSVQTCDWWIQEWCQQASMAQAICQTWASPGLYSHDTPSPSKSQDQGGCPWDPGLSAGMTSHKGLLDPNHICQILGLASLHSHPCQGSHPVTVWRSIGVPTVTATMDSEEDPPLEGDMAFHCST